MEKLYECKELVKTFKTGDLSLNALNGVNFTMEKGLIYTVLGPSGSGKTTLLNTLSGIDNLTSGEIIFNGTDISKLNERKLTEYRRAFTGFVFQSYNLIATLTVRENIELGRYLSKNPLEIDEIIKSVGMEEHKNKFPHQLSGGQQQRVAIARVLVKNPKIIFCDEPTGALDEKNGRDVLDLLQSLNKKYGTTLCMVTHNPNIGYMSNKVIRFKDGKIVNEHTNEKLKSAFEIEWA